MQDTRHRHPIRNTLSEYSAARRLCTYDTGDTAREGHKPEQTLRAAMGSMGGGTEGGTNDDHECGSDECDLATLAIADQPDDDLAEDGT